ncbi:MAG: hypothetical protein E7E64_12615 [Clostridium celatum]|nr:hypothetical protein [Paraclostridium bifermentans]MDU2123369.1 hypothetical protein [Clostridium celatum]MDU2491552.1 hypothetical protein [Clostridium celatum]MDU4325437.1 hypothetical protein [Clostridium celatum]MDU4884520.1 hypothetical protein [Clostridium celatum]MDU4980163.1 hypothetical protein [Clostridium celatum]
MTQRGCISNVHDIPTKKETKKKRTWFQKKNEHCFRKNCS